MQCLIQLGSIESGNQGQSGREQCGEVHVVGGDGGQGDGQPGGEDGCSVSPGPG